MITNNPIFNREFSFSVRSMKINLMVWGYLLLLASILLTLWPGGGVLSVVSERGRQIFSLFFNANLTLLILLVPAFSATSITYERENNTFNALFTTLLTPVEIVMGKLSACLTMLFVCVLLSLPIAAVSSLTGGVSLEFLMKVATILFVTAITYGLVGLACSAVCVTSYASILLNYALILLFAGGTWLPGALFGNLLGIRWLWQILRSASPYDALLFLLYPEEYRMTMSTLTALNPFLVFLISSGIISACALAVFCRRLTRPAERSYGLKGEVYSDSKKAMKRSLTWPFYLFDPLKRKKPIGRYSNPVFVAEMRSKLFANPKFVMRTVSAIFIISMVILTLIALQFGYSLRADTVRIVSIIFQIGVVAMLAPGVSSGLITDEITMGTFPALRMTRLSPVTVVLGKLKATFFYALIFIVSSLFILLAMAYLEQQQVFPESSIFGGAFWAEVAKRATGLEWWGKLWETYRSVFIWVCILLVSTVTFLAGGLFASSMSKTTGAATAVSYAITGIICVATLVPIAMGDRISPTLASAILIFNPVAAAIQATSDAFTNFPSLWKYNIAALIGLTLFFLVASTVRTWVLFHRQD